MAHRPLRIAAASRRTRWSSLTCRVLAVFVGGALLLSHAPSSAQDRDPHQGDFGTQSGGSAGSDRNVAPGNVVKREAHGDSPDEMGPTDRRWWTLGALLGAYATVGGFLYYAWYRDRSPHEFALRDEGWFGEDTYAGGADKLGHLFGNYLLMRSTYNVLRSGDFDSRTASYIAAGATTAMFALVEVKDGYHLAYSLNDQLMNLSGVAVGLALTQWPALDRAVDLRLSYFPSPTYRERLRDGDLDFVEDYSGMRFLLALHWPALMPRGLATDKGVLRTLGIFDLVVGYQTRHFFPAPSPPRRKSRELFIGVALNVQALWDWATDYTRGDAPWWGHVGHETTEMLQLPFTDQPLVYPVRARTDP